MIIHSMFTQYYASLKINVRTWQGRFMGERTYIP